MRVHVENPCPRFHLFHLHHLIISGGWETFQLASLVRRMETQQMARLDRFECHISTVHV